MSTPIYEESECDTQHALIQAPEKVDTLMDARKFSKLQKRLPVTAWVSWFADRSRPTQTSLGGTISTEELNLAEMFRICRVQLEVFTNDIEHLRLRDTVKKHSVLRDLHPHLDHSGQLRLRGRLENMDATKPFTICPAHFLVGHSFSASPEQTNSDYGALSAQATRRDLIEEPIFSRSIWPLGRVNYSAFNKNYDIALVKLDVPINFTDKVRPICLPEKGNDLLRNGECFATGWGQTRGSGSFATLKQAPMSELPFQECRNAGGLVFRELNEHDTFCAGDPHGEHGVCHGDSGGPLFCAKDGTGWSVQGVANAILKSTDLGTLCGVGSDSFWNRVSAHLPWIQHAIRVL
ncbi:hypothetical protein HPB49_009768 [Dermacentor silvarum]|uniref:Uncharacterized protein n=1 Tax=Dermacentor silvarum TaxID=543639 RepID=A0ACB8C2U7_DERSI|nr:hypothetical protein HPB49_009768 [Dermacentor silvarum]